MGRKNKRRKSSYSRKMKINPKKLIMRQQNTYEAMERTRMVRGLPFPAVLPETYMTKADAQKALDDIRSEAAGVPEMSLDEINAEIRATREENKT